MQRTQREILKLYEKYHDMVWRICLMQFGNVDDAYDGTQETFIRLMLCKKSFHGEEHEKAWLIRTAVNYCKDVKKSCWRKNLALEDSFDLAECMPDCLYETVDWYNEIFQAMMDLPEQYRVILYLHFYEGYSLKEISTMLKVNASTLRSRFSKAKELMKCYLEEET